MYFPGFDYSTSTYRDCSIARYLYSKLPFKVSKLNDIKLLESLKEKLLI